MVSGFQYGNKPSRRKHSARKLPKGHIQSQTEIRKLLQEESGYTSVAVAVSLLVCISLVMSLAMVSWRHNRAADVQSVADSAALAGANVVSAYSTVATTVDACVLTLGLTGMVTLGAGLVVSAIPGLSAAGATTIESGMKILNSKREFAASAAKGLKAVEVTLPLAIASRGYGVAQANDSEHANYTGCTIPFPQQSLTDFSGLDSEIKADGIQDIGIRLQEASDKAKEAQDALDDAAKDGWMADCGNKPRNLYERTETLARLSGSDNPFYSSPESWTFGVPLMRARAYYQQRYATEAPEGSSIEQLTDSAARRVFYSYALEQVRAGRYTELPDGAIDISLPDLPANTEQMKQTHMYNDAIWPCTSSDSGSKLHSTLACPAATGGSTGKASLAELDQASVVFCDTCRMSASVLGSVAAASTNIDNGFEHYWRRIVEASKHYKEAAEKRARAERELRQKADEGANLFDKVLGSLAVPRPKLCPPGAWGCIGLVGRSQTQTPEELSQAFISSGVLPYGAAASAAVLAPDSAEQGNDSITRLANALTEKMGGGVAGVLGVVGELWGRLLVAYGSAANGLSGAIDSILSGLEGIPFGSAAAWLKDRIIEIIKAAGFEPVDLRARKPVLTHTQQVLSQAGIDGGVYIRELIGRLPSSGDPASIAQALGQHVANKLGSSVFSLAEIPIPGTDIRIPLTIDVKQLLGGVAS